MQKQVEAIGQNSEQALARLSSVIDSIPKKSKKEPASAERSDRLLFFQRLTRNIQRNISALTDGSIVKPYAYQYRALHGLIDLFGNEGNGERTAYYVAPAGAGKTVLYAIIIRLLNVRSLILAPLSNLPLQAKGDFVTNAGIRKSDIGIVSGDVCDIGKPITIATYQGHVQKMKSNPDYRKAVHGCELVICDEAQTSLGDVTSGSIDRLDDQEFVFDNLDEQTSAKALKLGFSATPDLIKKSVASRFKILFAREYYSTLVQEGIIPKYKIIPIPATVLAGEIGDSISLERESILLERAEVYLRALRRLRKLRWEVDEKIYALAFCSSVNECDRLREIALSQRMRCRIVTNREYAQDSKIDHAQEAKEQLLHEEIDVVASVDKLEKGWNFPELNTVLTLRATLSPAIPPQEAGRAGRSHPSKKYAYIIEPRWQILNPGKGRIGGGGGGTVGKQRISSSGDTQRAPKPKYYRKPLTLAESLYLQGETDIEEVCEGLSGEKVSYETVAKLEEDGTVMINGILCAGISALASARGYDFGTLDNVVKELVQNGKLKPKGYALSRNRYVAVFELKKLEAIPYIRDRMSLPKITFDDPDVMIEGEPHTGINLLASIHGLPDVTTLREHVTAAGIQPCGHALTETHNVELYPRRPMEKLHYVKLRTTLKTVDRQTKRVRLKEKDCMGRAAFAKERNLTYSAVETAIAVAQLKPVGRALSPHISIPVYEVTALESLEYVVDKETLPTIHKETGFVVMGKNNVGIGLSALCTAHPKLKYATLKRLFEEKLRPIGYALSNGQKTEVFDAAAVLNHPDVQNAIDSRVIDTLRAHLAKLKGKSSSQDEPGSLSKVETLAQRHADGLPLWDDGDRSAYSEETDE